MAKRLPEETVDFAALLGQFDTPAFVPARTTGPAKAAPPETAPPRPLETRERSAEGHPADNEVREAEEKGRENSSSKASRGTVAGDALPLPSDSSLSQPSQGAVDSTGAPPTLPAAAEADAPFVEMRAVPEAVDKPSPELGPKEGSKPGLDASGPAPAPSSEVERVARAVAQLAETEGSGASTAPRLSTPALPDDESHGIDPAAVTSKEEDSAELSLDEALSTEEEIAELERQRQEAMERRRGLDEARIRAHMERPQAARPVGSGAAANGGFGQSDLGGRSETSKSTLATSSARPSASTPVEALAERLSSPQRGDVESAKAPPRARQALQAAVERLKELQSQRQLDSGRLALTIRIDESTSVKMTISPRGDGSHELAFLVADPKLRGELQRALPEIRSTATELPLEIAEVMVGALDEPDMSIESEQREIAGETL
ncbi:MAG: hypothetical protein AAFZ18_27550 [Myxococcota bacterium]